MSHWNGKEIVRIPPKPADGYPGWTWLDCGCCGGLQWGVATEYPTECPTCKGGGALCRHDGSGALALYPGGPFAGQAGEAKTLEHYGVRPTDEP